MLEGDSETPRGNCCRVNDLAPLYWQRESFGDYPSKMNVAHFVVPFLRFLGWPPNRSGKWRMLTLLSLGSPEDPRIANSLSRQKHWEKE